ncbi:alpha/beta hydrolase fold-domain-containing protein [Blastocladiella britannica]|nr:alpha/beta hydrolase fold-domain-containing protein [Blastocladiella britannica]
MTSMELLDFQTTREEVFASFLFPGHPTSTLKRKEMVLDHVYGKPSTTWKRAEALLVAFACAKILRAYHGRPPPGGKHIRALDHSLRKFAPWQIVLGTLTSGYLLSKFSLFTFTNSPEPYARYYNKNFYRATWILTALDAGFWTAMHIKPKPLRDVASILFTVFYLIFANRADYKVRRLRATPTLEMLRLSWEKQKHPLFSAMSSLMQPKIQWKGKQIHLPRSPASPGYIPSDPRTHTTILWLYFDGLPTDLAHVRNVILHFPGGGFVCMGPECHEDYLVEWAHRSPYTLVVAVDYLKAPEYPYPAAHDELFDLYRLIRETNGECLGLSGWTHEVSTSGFSSAGGSAKPAPERRRREPIKLTLSGDSAGGNLAAGIVTRCIETRVMLPDALILIYPHLEFDMACWMTPQNQNLARVESLKNVNAHVNIHRPGSMLNLSQQHGVGGALPSAIPVSAHQETVASSDNLAAQQQHHAADPMSLSIDMDDEMGEGDEYGNGGGTGLRRKRSFFALAQAKLSVLRTQKPHTVFDDYGGTPTAEHHHTFGGTPTTGTAPGSLMPKSPMFRPSTSRASSPGRSVAGSVYGGGSPYATLALTSHMANFNDRVLAPETMRALALLYVGPSMEPIDLMNDYYLSPRRTPDHILAQYPKTYFVVGERDPLVDDTVVTAGRIREAKQRAWAAGPRNTPRPSDTDICEVVILEGISRT